jgi:hypothetical protein
MVVVFAVLCAGLWVEEVVTSNELKDLEEKLTMVWACLNETNRRVKGAYHRGHAPDVCAGAPFGAQDDLGRTVLAGLNVVGKVMADPAGVAKIGNLYANDVEIDLLFFSFPLVTGAGRAAGRGGCGGGFPEADAGHFLGKDGSGRWLVLVQRRVETCI